MAAKSRPLLHPEVLRQQVRAFQLPERAAAAPPRLNLWAELVASSRADALRETALLPESLTDIFVGLLGYSGPAGPTDTSTLQRETHVKVDGQFADAVLGRENLATRSRALRRYTGRKPPTACAPATP